MAILFYDKELNDLMENFYILTGMKIVLFDENYQEIKGVKHHFDDRKVLQQLFEEYL